MSLFRADDPEGFTGASVSRAGEFSALIPPGKPILVRVTAPSYEDWHYGRDGTEQHAAPIRLAPGQTKEVVVDLRPAKK